MIKTHSQIKDVFVRLCHLNIFDQSISVVADIYKIYLRWGDLKAQGGKGGGGGFCFVQQQTQMIFLFER